MIIRPLRNDLEQYIRKRGLLKKFQKAARLLEANPSHPSLHTEILEPKHRDIYSFRIDRKYRAIFIVAGEAIEIIDINNYYQ